LCTTDFFEMFLKNYQFEARHRVLWFFGKLSIRIQNNFEFCQLFSYPCFKTSLLLQFFIVSIVSFCQAYLFVKVLYRYAILWFKPEELSLIHYYIQWTSENPTSIFFRLRESVLITNCLVFKCFQQYEIPTCFKMVFQTYNSSRLEHFMKNIFFVYIKHTSLSTRPLTLLFWKEVLGEPLPYLRSTRSPNGANSLYNNHAGSSWIQLVVYIMLDKLELCTRTNVTHTIV
jgi:hypothetical protein